MCLTRETPNGVGLSHPSVARAIQRWQVHISTGMQHQLVGKQREHDAKVGGRDVIDFKMVYSV